MDKETEDKGAVRHGLIMADGSVSIRNGGTVGLMKHTKPTAMRLKDQEADGTHGDNDRMCRRCQVGVS